MNIVAVVVPYFTYRWSRIFLRTFRMHFPDMPLLVIDNNPVPGERLIKRWKYDHAVQYFPICGEEEKLYRRDPLVTYIRNTIPASVITRTHGHGMDMAVDWCRRNNVERFLHLEPDSIVAGRKWYVDMATAIDRGAWIAMSSKTSYGAYIPTPGIFLTGEIKHSFEWTHKQNDMYHPAYKRLMDFSTFDGREYQLSLMRHWDEGEKIWFEAAKVRKFTETANKDYFHFGFSRARQPEWWLGDRVDGKTIRNQILSFHPVDTGLQSRLQIELDILAKEDAECSESKPSTDCETQPSSLPPAS